LNDYDWKIIYKEEVEKQLTAPSSRLEVYYRGNLYFSTYSEKKEDAEKFFELHPKINSQRKKLIKILRTIH